MRDVQDSPTVVTPDDRPASETVRIIAGIQRVMHTPEILEGRTSSTGKTITVTVREGTSNEKTYRLDTETILSGGTEFRDSRTFELYTPERFRKNQRANHAPGPVAGADEVSDTEDLPPATHVPEADIRDAVGLDN